MTLTRSERSSLTSTRAPADLPLQVCYRFESFFFFSFPPAVSFLLALTFPASRRPRPDFFETCRGRRIQNLFLKKINKNVVPRSTVNNVRAHEICKSSHSVSIETLHGVPTFLVLGTACKC